MKFPQAGIDATDMRGHLASDACVRVEATLDLISDIVGTRSDVTIGKLPVPTRTAKAPRQDRSESPVTFDSEALIGRCAGNVPLAKTILEKFKTQFINEVLAIRRGCDELDYVNIARLAHRLKGASASVSAARLQRIFHQVEEAGLNQQVELIPESLEALEENWIRFWKLASSFIENGTGAHEASEDQLHH